MRQPPLPTLAPYHCSKKPRTPEQKLLHLKFGVVEYPVTYPLHTWYIPPPTVCIRTDSVCKPTWQLASIQVSHCMGFGNKASELSYLTTWLVRAQIRDRGMQHLTVKGRTERSWRGLPQPPFATHPHTCIYVYIYIYACIHMHICRYASVVGPEKYVLWKAQRTMIRARNSVVLQFRYSGAALGKRAKVTQCGPTTSH